MSSKITCLAIQTKYFLKKRKLRRRNYERWLKVDRDGNEEFKIYRPALQTRPSNVTGRSSEAFISPTYHQAFYWPGLARLNSLGPHLLPASAAPFRLKASLTRSRTDTHHRPPLHFGSARATPGRRHRRRTSTSPAVASPASRRRSTSSISK